MKSIFGKYMIFDLETNGLDGEILQFGWIIFVIDKNGIHKNIIEHEHIVKQNIDFNLDIYASQNFHKISMDIIKNKGAINIKDSLLKFIDNVNTCDFISGYNIKSFDCTKIETWCHNSNIPFDKNSLYKKCVPCDVLYIVKRYFKYLGLKEKAALNYCYPIIIGNELPDGQYHSALYDCKITKDIFCKIYEKNPDLIIKFISDEKKKINKKQIKNKNNIDENEKIKLKNHVIQSDINQKNILDISTDNKVINFGKYKGLTYRKLLENDSSYVNWCINLKTPSDRMKQFINQINPLYDKIDIIYGDSVNSFCNSRVSNDIHEFNNIN